jgi:hypothetical protein
MAISQSGQRASWLSKSTTGLQPSQLLPALTLKSGPDIGSEEDQTAWIEAKVEDWTCVIAELAIVALSHPQSAYTCLCRLAEISVAGVAL